MSTDRTEKIAALEKHAPLYAERMNTEHYWWVPDHWPNDHIFFVAEEVSKEDATAFCRWLHETDSPGHASMAPDHDGRWNVTVRFYHATETASSTRLSEMHNMKMYGCKDPSPGHKAIVDCARRLLICYEVSPFTANLFRLSHWRERLRKDYKLNEKEMEVVNASVALSMLAHDFQNNPKGK